MLSLDHDERARQQYALALNRYVQTTLAEGSRLVCDRVVVPALGLTGIRDRLERRRLRQRMEREPQHRLWLAMMQVWQDLLWRYSGECVDRQLDTLVERCRLRSGAAARLRLDASLELPAYQLAVDNHSLPGGYHAETREDDVRQGAIYALSSTTYLLQQTGPRHEIRGHTLLGHVRMRFPDLVPAAVLDLGCLVGASTAVYAELLPGARIEAIDTSAPALRFAAGSASERGLAIGFSRQNAEHTDFPDGSFDLVVSHALLHETSRTAVRNIFTESLRLLRPGGVMAHIEVPARIESLDPWEYLRSAYEGHYNQEPFWNGVVEEDLAQIASAAGFVEAHQGFQQVVPDAAVPPVGASFVPVDAGRLDLGNWFVVSARKPATGGKS